MRQKQMSFYSISWILLGLLLLTGCGSSLNAQSPSHTDNKHIPVLTSTADAHASEPVTLRLDKTTYAKSDVINVTITNNAESILDVLARGTNCSPLRLMYQVNNDWQLQEPCSVTQPASHFQLKKGATTVQQLKLEYGNRETFAPLQWQSGTYRVELFYQTVSDSGSTRSGGNVRSQCFIIG